MGTANVVIDKKYAKEVFEFSVAMTVNLVQLLEVNAKVLSWLVWTGQGR